MSSPIKESQMPPLASPIRRKRLHTEDNIRISDRFSASNLKKARINTLQNQQQLILPRQPSLRKIASSKLNLSPIKYYETKLSLSCETWAAFSINDGVYKRGWKPNRPAEFNGLIRLVVAMVYLEIVQQHPEATKLTVRTNHYLLCQQKDQRKSLKQLLKLKQEKNEYLLAQNTIIPLNNLVAAMLVSNNNELLVYSAIFVGYQLSLLSDNPKAYLEHTQPAVLESFNDGVHLMNIFAEHANAQLSKRYKETSISSAYEFFSTPNEISQFFAELIGRHKSILTMLEAKEVVSAIRFQVGFKFYEDRTKRFPSERVHPVNHVVLSCRGKNNFGVVSYNKITSLVLALHDCKFSMAEVDINRIEQWFKSTSRPAQGRQKSKLLPLLKLLQ